MGPTTRWTRSDEGIGLIEIVVAMFLLALVAVVLLPLLISGMQLAARNTTIAAATQLANDRIHAAQAAGGDCDSVFEAITGGTDHAITTQVDQFTDQRGVDLEVTTTITGTCPASGADTIRVDVQVTRADTGDSLVSASTLVLVTVAP